MLSSERGGLKCRTDKRVSKSDRKNGKGEGGGGGILRTRHEEKRKRMASEGGLRHCPGKRKKKDAVTAHR